MSFWQSFDVCFVFRLELMADAGVSVNLQRQIMEELDAKDVHSMAVHCLRFLHEPWSFKST